jgi:leader peptidase (prepilin peptidase)/N-methyltransferase
VPSPLVFVLIGFGVGLLFGSFLNVCISRVPSGESIVKPRSHCMACGHPIRWYDNIPVLSWLFLRARCRDCKAKIQWRYPIVELTVGLWLLNVGSRFETLITSTWNIDGPLYIWWITNTIDLIGLAILGFLLIGLLVMDWQTHRLPDAFTLTGTAIGLFLVCVQAIFLAPGEGAVILANQHLRLRSPGAGAYEGNVFLTGAEALVFGRIAAVAGAALLLLAVRWLYKAIRKRDGMGLGDVKLMMLLAAFIGFSQSLLALLLGVLSASLYALILLARRRAFADTRLPFGSFLAAGGLLAALWGQQIVGWYITLLH